MESEPRFVVFSAEAADGPAPTEALELAASDV
jgi:hypothetical protein